MTNYIKTVAAIHDLSGYGRCSLSVILPILSIMGIQPIAIPTAILSTHTGYSDVTIIDLTHYLKPALSQYHKIGLNFDCIYTGFLNGVSQIEQCKNFVESYPNALTVIDPVMGDHGKIYRTYTSEMCQKVRELVTLADIITPNITEMSLLLNVPYISEPLTAQVAKSNLLLLSKLGPKQVIVTGVPLADGTICNIGYDANTNFFWRITCSYVPVSYPGTGDIFASIVVASILNGDSLPLAIERATRFLELCIKTTYSYNTDTRQGIMLEKCISWLAKEHSFDGYVPL